MILVSACLLGENCKYSGGNNRNDALCTWLEDKEYLPICPETAGGLPIPRPPCEIVGGEGADVLNGKARILDRDGKDRSREFLLGAEKVLQTAISLKAESAILKANSPSCGSNGIYDGSFSGGKRPGLGLTAELLKRHGIRLYDETNYAGNVNIPHK